MFRRGWTGSVTAWGLGLLAMELFPEQPGSFSVFWYAVSLEYLAFLASLVACFHTLSRNVVRVTGRLADHPMPWRHRRRWANTLPLTAGVVLAGMLLFHFPMHTFIIGPVFAMREGIRWLHQRKEWSRETGG